MVYAVAVMGIVILGGVMLLVGVGGRLGVAVVVVVLMTIVAGVMMLVNSGGFG